jgi:hypothetical protein
VTRAVLGPPAAVDDDDLALIFSPLPSHPRWSTVVTAALVLVVVTWRTRRPLRGAVAVLAWLSLYEITWQACDVLTHRGSLAAYGWLSLAVVAWPLLALQLGIRPHPLGLAVCAGGFAAWLALGFDYNWVGQPQPLKPLPEALNLLTKTSLGLAYLAGALAPPAAGARPTVLTRGTEPARRARGGTRA